jgi:hypothetical protein
MPNEPNAIVQAFRDQNQSAQIQATQSLEYDPDKAARAYQLEQATGIPSSYIFNRGEPEEFEDQYRSNAVRQLVHNNPRLQDYINSHPMAAAISNDGIGSLDNISQKMDDYHGPKSSSAPGAFVRSAAKGVLPMVGSLPAIGAGAEVGAGVGMIAGPIGAAAGGIVGGAIGGLGGSYALALAQDWLLSKLPNHVLEGMGFDPEQARLDLAEHGTATFLGGLAPFLLAMRPGAIPAGTLREGATAFERVMNKPIAQRLLSGTAMAGFEAGQEAFHGEIEPEKVAMAGAFGAVAAKSTAFGESAMAQGQKLAGRIFPYLRAGKEPPVGLDPTVDKIHAEEAKERMKKLDDLFQAVQSDPTKQRDPNFFRQKFLELFPDARLEIDAAAVRKLYGDKTPEEGDGILGFVKDINQQLDMEEASGGRITVPLNDKLAFMDPEVFKELHDFIATKPGGMTLEEAKAPVKEEKEGEEAISSGNEAVDAVRRAAGLDPMMALPRELAGISPVGGLDLPPAATFEPIEVKSSIGEKASSIANYTVSQAIAHIDTSGMRGLTKGLFDFFSNRLEKYVGDVPIMVVTREDMSRLNPNAAAYYSIDQHHIVVANDTLAGRFGKDFAAETLIHEMGHAFTTRVIKTDSRVARDVYKLLNETKDLVSAADPESLKKFDYAFTRPVEFMAEAWSNKAFQELLASLPMSPELAERLGMEKRTGSMWEGVRKIIADFMERLLGVRPEDSMLDGVMKISEGIEGKITDQPKFLDPGSAYRYGKEIIDYAQKTPEQPELPEAGTTRIEDMLPFGKAFIGMTAKRTKGYVDAVRAMIAENYKKAYENALKDKAKEGTQEWKAAEKEMRSQVAERVNNRPDIAADSLLRYGVLQDIKLPHPPRISAEGLTPEQIAALPQGWVVKRGGVAADDIASMFGYPSADQMVQRLAELHKSWKDGNIRRETYIQNTIDTETKQHMEATYKDFGQNKIKEAQDQALSETSENLLHEQTLFLAEKAKLQYPIKKEELAAAVKQDMADGKMGRIDRDRYLADAGRAGGKMEDAWQKEDFAEAFRQSQAQQLAFLRAKEAGKYEKIKDGTFKRRADKFYKRDVPGMEPSFTNFMHLIMLRTGQEIKRSIPDLEKEISKGVYKNLNDFVGHYESVKGGAYDMDMPDWLLDPKGKTTTVDELTGQQFMELHKAMTAMEHVGRNIDKVWKAGDKADLREVIKEMVAKIASLGAPRTDRIDLGKKADNSIMNHMKSFWWSGINVETMLNRIDRDDPHGIMFQTIVRDYTQAYTAKDREIREYQNKLSAVTKIPDIDKKVENNLFVDPNTGEYFQMRKRNVLGILQNWGNASNRRKLSKGYGLKPDDIERWLLQNTTKEDWERAQKIGDLFKELFDKADRMKRELSGTGIEGLELEPFTNPHGTFDGWYNPVKYDPVRPGASKALLGPEAETEAQYFRATTNQSYTKGRTGYIAPMELNLDMIPVRMRQMIHDINLRPTIQQLSKIFYDREFKQAMIAYYGRHQAESFIPFLNDLAGAGGFKSNAEYMGSTALEYFRQNLIATLIGFNPSTVMKHGLTAAFNSLTQVGILKPDFYREFTTLAMKDPISGMTNWGMAMDKSDLLKRRVRAHFTDLITGHEAELHLAQHSLRDFMIGLGATPVSISDLMTAVPTWLAVYKKSIVKGEDEGMAVALADRAVRMAHGDSALSNKPAIMRTNALGAWFSSLYGFFSHMQQRQYELTWKAKDMLRDTFGKGSGDAEMATRHAPDLLKGLMSYVIFPAAVEELVTPYLDSEKDSWGKKAAKSLAFGISSSTIGIRDVVRAIIDHRDPQAGLVGTGYKAFTDLQRDFTKKGPMNRESAGNIIKHTAVLGGVLTGLTNAQEGRALEYLYRYSEGLERPQGPWGHLVGLRYGTIKKHSRSFDDYMKHFP